MSSTVFTRIPEIPVRYALGTKVHGTSYRDATGQIMEWASQNESRSVCVANVHTVMEAYDRHDFRNVINGADLVTPDGMPLVWSLKLEGVRNASRVYGPDLTPFVLRAAEQQGVPVGFYGGSSFVLDRLLARVKREYPRLPVVFAQSPPYRPLTLEEDREMVKAIRRSGARVLFVGLGCPKQERWMADHRGQIQAVMVGVGAAFDFLAGSKRQSPRWMQAIGLEWLFRFATEPRRLWKRYMKHNPRFVVLMAVQLMARLFRAPVREVM
jgi:N-acetylglucosaminyldiphosphoundecaprenol N-acetyl-beta-D-mannosaminyltransferase